MLQVLEKTGPIVMVITAVMMVGTQFSADSLHYFIGSILIVLIAKTLKKAIRQPRPSSGSKEDFGKPSSHSAAIMFMGCYACLWVAYELDHLSELSDRIWGHSFETIAINSAVLVVCFVVVWSRVYLGHHNFEQVGAGSVLGVVFGWIWRRYTLHLFLESEYIALLAATRSNFLASTVGLVVFLASTIYLKEHDYI
ncbi:hypothetical protein HDU79_000699 [Rhizoclosmatium sp. JEL0117]|nr:hypothetical protein HDU79_000699 [Rhizoclosmatium sp. JEL0117]